jgi:hypothetical protein
LAVISVSWRRRYNLPHIPKSKRKVYIKACPSVKILKEVRECHEAIAHGRKEPDHGAQCAPYTAVRLEKLLGRVRTAHRFQLLQLRFSNDKLTEICAKEMLDSGDYP